ncbi:hypothetical protein LINPERHAP1_LOCUS735 [Linum perenne]
MDTPLLQNIAIKLLSQTASSSGCERNWSVFERIHTKRRNRLEHKRLSDLVFVHCWNLRFDLPSTESEDFPEIEFLLTIHDASSCTQIGKGDRMIT